MREGLLWFDADPNRDLSEKVRRAADRYHFKFGRRPNLCYVNPSMMPPVARAGDQLANGSFQLNGVRLMATENVLKHHFWIGIGESSELREAA
jgi:hypothetical protein